LRSPQNIAGKRKAALNERPHFLLASNECARSRPVKLANHYYFNSTAQVASRVSTLDVLLIATTNAAIKPIVIKSTMVGAGALLMKNER
jgi:hypothetical protein